MTLISTRFVMAGTPDAKLANRTVCWSVLKLLMLSRPRTCTHEARRFAFHIVRDALRNEQDVCCHAQQTK